MKSFRGQEAERVRAAESPDYLRGYRDGVRDRRLATRPAMGDGLLGALLAIALIAGVGYLGYRYATTGRILPADINLPASGPVNPQ